QRTPGPQEVAHVGQQRRSFRDGEVVDVVVQRGDVAVAGGGTLPDVGQLDVHPRGEAPAPDVLAGGRDDVRGEIDPDGGELRIAVGRVADMDARATTDLEQANQPSCRHDVLDRLAHERLDRAGRAADQVARQGVPGERARVAQASPR